MIELKKIILDSHTYLSAASEGWLDTFQRLHEATVHTP